MFKASRDLDAKIAIYLFGWQWLLDPIANLVRISPPDIDIGDHIILGASYEGHEKFIDWDLLSDYILRNLPYYSRDIGDAWLVVDKITEMDYGKINISCSHYHGCYVWICVEDKEPCEKIFVTDAFDLPAAICEGALKAIGINGSQRRRTPEVD